MKTKILRTILIAVMMITCISDTYSQLYFDNINRLFVGPRTKTIYNNDPTLFITTFFGIEHYENGLNVFRGWDNIYYGDYKLFIDETGKIGMGRKPTTYALEVNGAVWTPSGLLIASDASLKKNITDINDSSSDYLNKLLNLKGRSYEKRIYDAERNSGEVERMVNAGKIPIEEASAALDAMNRSNPTIYKKEFGFIAQEVEEFFPELVEKNAEGLLSVNYIGFIPLLLESIKEQQTRIEELSLEIEKIKSNSSSDELFRSSNDITGTKGISNPLLSQCKLHQNAPNPFKEKTEIRYYIPEEVEIAEIYIFNLQGSLLKKISAPHSGLVEIKGSNFQAGMYIYTLVADGQAVDTKRMILTK